MKRLASIDIGTNTIRMVVFESGPNGDLREIFSERGIVRLGEGIDSQKKILEHRMENAIRVLQSFLDICRKFGDVSIFAVATSAVREATNRQEFLDRVIDEVNLEIDVIPWEEEARLTLNGVLWKLSPDKQPLLTFDIGGGSTEYILSEGQKIICSVGTKLGVVRLTEKFITRHPVDPDEYGQLMGFLKGELQSVKNQMPDQPLGNLIGTAGTVTTLAAIDRNIYPYDPLKIHGMVLKKNRIHEIQEILKGKTKEERLELNALERGREDLIISGTALTLQTMETFGMEDLLVSEYGLREGIVLKYIN